MVKSTAANEGIVFQDEPWPEQEILESLHPFVREWFETKFGTFSPPQRFSVLNIKRGINTLISSPTGSGKTLSAFLAIIDNLVTLADKGQLEQQVYALYISPLKALANDINKNLKEPLKEIGEIAKRNGRELKIRVATRTGDTTPSQKQGMLKNSPHILITTPESMAISLASTKFSIMLKAAQYVIIDEIHSLADNKRGTQLALCLEQLEDVKQEPVVRIGLSATVRPLEAVANFLVGMLDPEKNIPRPCRIIDVQFLKQLDLKVLSPVKDLVKTDHAKTQRALYTLLNDLIQNHRTTLVFTNTRSGTERVVHQLKDIFPRNYTGILDADETEQNIEVEGRRDKEARALDEEFSSDESSRKVLNDNQLLNDNRLLNDNQLPVTRHSKEELLEQKEKTSHAITKEEGLTRTKAYIGAHHGSLSKRHRLDIENRLKRGELKAVVCSTSLELGIDIGYVDLVVLLGSPKSVARGLQRIGRSGHKLHETAKGRIIVMNRDDLVECSVLLKSAIEKKIDKIMIPQKPLDVLAQMIYGFAIDKIRHIDEMYALIRRAYVYRNLSRESFQEVIDYLSGEYVTLEKRHVYGKIWYDRETQMIGKRGKLARLIFMTNVGTIPDETNIKVKMGDLILGTITEGFLERLKPGDVFVLGGEAYEFRYTRGLTATVKTSGGRPPTVPRWVSEMLPLSFELAQDIQTFRQYLAQMFEQKRSKQEILDYIDEYLYVDKNAVQAIYNYFNEQFQYSMIPHRKRLVIEQFHEGNTKYAIYHTLYGRRTNDVLSRAMAFAHARMTGRDVEMGINDNGFYLKSTHPIPARRLLSLIKAKELRSLMAHALDKTEVLRMRFRHCAARALMILRKYKGQSKSVGKQQMSSRLLLYAVKEIGEDFPILQEARREVLEDLMDIRHAEQILREIQSSGIKVVEAHHDLPSPFAFNMILQAYTDLLKMEDRAQFLLRMHEMVLAQIADKKGGKPKKEAFKAPELDFSYDRLWDEQHALERKKKEDFTEYLHELFRRAARKVGLEADLVYDGHLLIDGDDSSVRREFWDWLDGLLGGAVPKVWHDDLVKFFIKKSCKKSCKTPEKI